MVFLKWLSFVFFFYLGQLLAVAEEPLSSFETSRLQTEAKQSLVENYLNSINPSLEMLGQMSNKYQLEAFNLLMDYTDFLEVQKKLSGILELSNKHQVRSLKAILSSANTINYDIHDLKDISQKFQSEVIEILTQHRSVDLKKSMPTILQFDNRHSVEVLRVITSANYEVTYSLYDISQLDEKKQTDLIKKRVEGRFHIDGLFPIILFTCKKLF